MIRLLICLLMAAALTTHAAPAKKKKKRAPAAASAPQQTPMQKAQRTIVQRFSGLKLKGQLKKPDLSYIYKRKGLRAEQIIDIPEDFNAQIIQGETQF